MMGKSLRKGVVLQRHVSLSKRILQGAGDSWFDLSQTPAGLSLNCIDLGLGEASLCGH
jgi:hypothetical protein